MRTYEIELTTVIKRTITSEKTEDHRTLTEAALALEGIDASNLVRSRTIDITPKPKTDKQRFNDAFRELRKLGYNAKQGLTPHDDGVDVYTMKGNVEDAFRHGVLHGTVLINWEYGYADKTDFHKKRVQIIRSVFESHGFVTEWEGEYYNCIEIRKGSLQ